MTTLVSKDKESGALWGNVASCKGPGDMWLVRKQVRNVELIGRANIGIKTDGEPAIVAVQNRIITLRGGKTVPRNPPAYNPESNGPIEKGVQDLNNQLRALKIALEARLGMKIKCNWPVMEWLVPHAAFVVTRYRVGHDGKSAFQRCTGRQWRRPIVEFGEQVMGKLARQRMERGTRSKNSTVMRKLIARSVQGTWVGMVERTGENIIVVGATGKAVRVRTINRLPEETRWNADLVIGIKATPRRPNPNAPETEKTGDVIEAPHDEDFGPMKHRPGAPTQRIPRPRPDCANN